MCDVVISLCDQKGTDHIGWNGREIVQIVGQSLHDLRPMFWTNIARHIKCAVPCYATGAHEGEQRSSKKDSERCTAVTFNSGMKSWSKRAQ